MIRKIDVVAVSVLVCATCGCLKQNTNSDGPRSSEAEPNLHSNSDAGCNNFSKEEKLRAHWTSFLRSCLHNKAKRKVILGFLRNAGFQIVEERTHYSVRLLPSAGKCYNKTLVYRLFFKQDSLISYKFKYGVSPID